MHRRIGPRDEAKLLGGIGPCGRMLCCATFLPDYARVSIKMAKDQDLPLNPTKISGVCGRLLCCLSYEHEQYLAIKAELPRKGSWVQTPDGPGEVITVNVVRETVIVELAGSGIHEEFRPDQISEAAQRVAQVARSRAEEGITPRPNLPPPPPRREPKHTGERRLLRDEVIDPDILDALAMLEEGEERTQSARPAERTPPPRPAPAEATTEAPVLPPTRPTEPRRPQQPQARTDAEVAPRAEAGTAPAQSIPARPADARAPESRAQRHRRKRGKRDK